MTVLYLTNNFQLAGTARILLSWITIGEAQGVEPCVAVQRPGTLLDWLTSHRTPSCVSRMRWMSLSNPVPSLADAWRLARWARARGVDVIHCNEHDVYPFAVLVRAFLRVPAVCHVRFVVSREFTTWAFKGWRQPDALLWTTDQQRLDSAAAMDDVVPAERQFLVRLGPDPATFFPADAARSERRRALQVTDGQIAVGMASALRPIKAVDEFIDVVEHIGATDDRVVGLIAGGIVPGDEGYAEHIKERVARSPLGLRLRFLGHLDAVAPFLQALDVFVSTSHYETFGNSVCEAMACRVPVTAYVGGSVGEVIGDAGRVVRTGDVSGLAAATGLYVADTAARADAARRGYERATTEFSPQRSFERLQRIHAGVVKRSLG